VLTLLLVELREQLTYNYPRKVTIVMDEYYDDDDDDKAVFTTEELKQMRVDLGPPEYYPEYNIDGILLSTN